MKNYLFKWENCSSTNAGQTMNRLKSEGWKNLIFRNGGDFNSDSIQGYRPMTKQEIKDREKAIKKEIKEEIKELKNLAKKHGYALTKEPKESLTKYRKEKP
ncbi:hypothetical protein D4R86_00275 [bacterium]|nr:MAG: hypothetical protein D4R86_00275 [bacterium]